MDQAFFFSWVLLPALIFSARLCDVSLGTLRVIFISRGFRYIAPVIGFFEVIIWLLAIGQVMSNLTNVVAYIAYGGGFAAGTFAGMFIEERLSIGTVIVRLITRDDAPDLVAAIRALDYGVTVMDAAGSTGRVNVIFMVVMRHDLPEVIGTIRSFQPNAFYTVEDVRTVTQGVFPEGRRWLRPFA